MTQYGGRRLLTTRAMGEPGEASKGPARQEGPDLGAERGVLFPEPADDGANLLHDLCLRLAGNRPALDLQPAPGRVRAGSRTTPKGRRVEGRGSDQRVRGRGPQLLLELLQTSEEAPHPHVGVDPFLEPAPVGRASEGLDLDPAKPLVSEADLELGWLGYDGGIGGEGGQHIGHPDARGLLVRDRDDQEVAGERDIRVAESPRRREARGEPGLHVVGPRP